MGTSLFSSQESPSQVCEWDPQGDSVIHNTQHVKKALSFPGAGAQSGRDVRVPLQA
jgi:hypothetical protein